MWPQGHCQGLHRTSQGPCPVMVGGYIPWGQLFVAIKLCLVSDTRPRPPKLVWSKSGRVLNLDPSASKFPMFESSGHMERFGVKSQNYNTTNKKAIQGNTKPHRDKQGHTRQFKTKMYPKLRTIINFFLTLFVPLYDLSTFLVPFVAFLFHKEFLYHCWFYIFRHFFNVNSFDSHFSVCFTSEA